ncbi:Transcriptional regulator, TetR family [Streptomyces sp. ADI92-24]|uniref:TetR/AcrR family transcriptional regulator n=1 Tax=unclassified Streptomyces TaxID=2593676 RepID=UPI000F55136A|nr:MULTISPECIES: TetR/AcrR family transcriptional regulator [unclassified Streptomyces]MCX4774174.1 TetR family transcriptional regulator [Streptomyces sp. NBC_01285]RPK36659.1 Transcriptional regulator, TetR family [Streptomyces sp. ADI92-24]
MATRTTGSARAELITDAALALLAERGMRGLTHRAVDERAGLPQGSTSNYARTRQSLLEATVRRLAERESRVLAPGELPAPGGTADKTGTAASAPAPGAADAGTTANPSGPPAPSGPPGQDALIAGLALSLHRYLTHHPELLICRYELALEATRRPELRAFFDATGRQFREPLVALMTAAGSPEPERHALSLVAWCEGLMFSCAAGSSTRSVPSEAELRTGFGELLRGMLGH